MPVLVLPFWDRAGTVTWEMLRGLVRGLGYRELVAVEKEY